MVSSLDAGTAETYAKIHGVDLFDKVCYNLEQYARHGLVELKYIILPNINDNENDIFGFLSLCERIKNTDIAVSRDYFDTRPFSEHTINMIVKLVQNGRQLGMNVGLVELGLPASPDLRKRLNETSQ